MSDTVWIFDYPYAVPWMINRTLCVRNRMCSLWWARGGRTYARTGREGRGPGVIGHWREEDSVEGGWRESRVA